MIFDLPAPNELGTMSLVECIKGRRSLRKYDQSSIPISYLSQLLWSAQGITGPDRESATPSAGRMYPLQLNVVVQRVEGLEPGVYEYDGDSHSMKLLDSQFQKVKVQDVGIGDQPWLGESAIVIGVAARLDDVIDHFASQPPEGERGRRYVYMESGALAQNVHLLATSLELGCVLVGGFDDSQAKEMLMLSSELEPTALICIGNQRGI